MPVSLCQTRRFFDDRQFFFGHITPDTLKRHISLADTHVSGPDGFSGFLLRHCTLTLFPLIPTYSIAP